MIKIYLTLFVIICVLSFQMSIAQNHEIDSLEKLLNEYTGEDTIRIHLLNHTAYNLHTVDIEKSLHYAKEASKLSDQINFPAGKAESQRIIGIYHILKTNYSRALQHLDTSLQIVEKSGDENGIIKCLINIGNVYRIQGNYSLALDNLQESLVIAEKINDKKGVSNCLIHIGIVYYEMQDYQNSLEYFHKSLKIYKDVEDKMGVTYALNDIALSYEKLDQLDKALEYYDQCIEIAEEIDFTHILGWAYNGKGIILMKQQNYEQALEFLIHGLEKRISLDERKDIAQSYISIGNLYIKTNQYAKAKENLLKGYKIAKEINTYLSIKNAAEGLTIIYEKSGDYKKSLEYHKIFKQYSDSLINQENIKKLASFEIKTAYEKEKHAMQIEQQKKDALTAEKAKRQKTINIASVLGFIMMTILALTILYSLVIKRRANEILINQKNEIEAKNIELQNLNEEIQTQAEELKDKNDKLNEINATKDKLFTIIAHDLKSPFNAFLGISEQLAEDHKTYTDDELGNYLKLINDGAKKTSILLENLLTWAQSQTGKIKFNPEKINVKTLINTNISFFSEMAAKKDLRIIAELQEEVYVFADKMMIETVIRNLLTNAIKFTPKGGKIILSSGISKNDRNKHMVLISINDSGVGIPSDIQSKLFNVAESITTKGTENETGTGLGLIVCKEFVEKHGGKIWIKSEINKGSEFMFTMPLSS